MHQHVEEGLGTESDITVDQVVDGVAIGMECRDEHHGVVVTTGCIEVELAELVHAGWKSMEAEVGLDCHRSRFRNTEKLFATAEWLTPAGTGLDQPQRHVVTTLDFPPIVQCIVPRM